MKVANILSVLVLLVLVAASVPEYDKGLGLWSKNGWNPKPIYTSSNIFDNLYIPQYNSLINDYVSPVPLAETPQFAIELVRELTTAVQSNNLTAMVMLADILLYGQYATKPQYSRALELYEQAVALKADGHAYFMLGFIYSTGLFGEITPDQAKANLYYQMGVENDDTNAILAVAYRNHHGIGVPNNCGQALHYYSRLANHGMQFLRDTKQEDEEDDLLYNIRVSDFNGGLFGNKMSEMPNSIFLKSNYYSESKKGFDDFHSNDFEEQEFVSFYYNGLNYHDGDYFLERNLTKSVQQFASCVKLGARRYASNNYRGITSLDKMFLSRCQAKLAHFYLKGYGVEQDFEKAKYLLDTSLSIEQTPSALNDRGFIEEWGLGREENVTAAYEYYKKSNELSDKNNHHGKTVHLAKLLTRLAPNEDPSSSEFKDQIYNSVHDAVFSGSTAALFYFAEYHQSGMSRKLDPSRGTTCASVVMYYKIFVARLERLFLPHLKYAFEELLQGRYKNALIAYLIAAEQGFEPAQVSAADLLYQLQPIILKHNKKTYTKDRILAAITYLERASSQNNVDATIFLGDLYFNGVQDVLETDFNSAFLYYKKACRTSSHGCYNLGYMYEYGLGPVNHTDYYMAKRYYDSSLEYRSSQQTDKSTISYKIPINWALLRLRLKYLFDNEKDELKENYSWLSAFKKIGKNTQPAEDRGNAKAKAHHEGSTLDEFDVQYDFGDYFVIAITVALFGAFFVQGIVRQWRRRNNGGQQEEGANNNNNNVQWNAQFGGGNFEFHFFAL